MAKVTIVPIDSTLTNTAANTINQNFNRVQAAIENTLSRNGQSPNPMVADLDMNGNDLLNIDTLDVHNLTIDGQPLPNLEEMAELAERAEDAALKAENSAAAIGTLYIEGAIADGVANDRAAIQATIDAAIAQAGDGFVIVDGRGYTYAIDGPLSLGTGVQFQNFKLVALTSANWTSANAMLQILTGFNVLVKSVYFEGNKQAKNCFINTQAGFIRMADCRSIRFQEKGYWIKADIIMINCQAQQYGTGDAEFPSVGNGFNYAPLNGYPLYLSDAATDSKFIGCVFSWGATCFYIDYNVHHIQFIGCHFFNGVQGGARPNSKNGEIKGYRIQFIGCYLDLGAIWYYKDATNTIVDMTVSGCISLYQASNALFDGWFVVTTSVASSTVDTLRIGPDNQWSGNGAIPVVNLKVTGAGSWDVHGALNSVTDDLAAVGDGLNIVATTPSVAQALRVFSSHPSFSLARYRSIGTVNAQGIEYGANGAFGTERVNGTAIRNFDLGGHNFLGYAVKNAARETTVIAASYVLTQDDLGKVFICNNGGTAITITLPATIVPTGGAFHFEVVARSAGVVTLQSSGGALLNGSAGASAVATANRRTEVVMPRNNGGSAAEYFT